MSQADFDGLMGRLNSARNTPLVAIHCGMPPSIQEVANDAWADLGKRMGFKPFTVEGTSINPRFFSAEPTEDGALVASDTREVSTAAQPGDQP